MKTYAVITGKKEGEYLEKQGGICVGSHSRANGYHPAGGLVEVVKTDHTQLHSYIYRFKLRKQAIAFAIWAAGWIAAGWSDHTVPIISLE